MLNLSDAVFDGNTVSHLNLNVSVFILTNVTWKVCGILVLDLLYFLIYLSGTICRVDYSSSSKINQTSWYT